MKEPHGCLAGATESEGRTGENVQRIPAVHTHHDQIGALTFRGTQNLGIRLAVHDSEIDPAPVAAGNKRCRG